MLLTIVIFHQLSGHFTVQNGAGASNGQDGDVIGLFHPQKERVHFLEANLDKLSFQHRQVGYIIGAGRDW